MKNLQFRRTLAILTAAIVTVASVPVTTGAETFMDESPVEDSEAAEVTFDDEEGAVEETTPDDEAEVIGETDDLYSYESSDETEADGIDFSSEVSVLDETSDSHAVKIELAADEVHWFIKESNSNPRLEPSKDVEVTYSTGETKTVSPDELDVTSTVLSDNSGYYIPGKYTRTISYDGCSVTDDIYIVGFGESENGIPLEQYDLLQGQTAGSALDTYSFYRISQSEKPYAYYDVSLTNVSGNGQVVLYSRSKRSIITTLNVNGKSTLSFEWESYSDDYYYIIVQGEDTLSYDIEYERKENKLTLDETTSIKSDSGKLSDDATCTFTPEISGFYKITGENCSEIDIETSSGSYLGCFTNKQSLYLKKGQKYWLRVSVEKENATLLLSLKEATSSYESYSCAGRIDEESNLNYWTFDGTTLELSGKGSLKNTSILMMIGYQMYDVKSLIIQEGYTSISSSYFKDLGNLESASLPASLESIGIYAFYKLDKLKEIRIAENSKLSSIGAHAFDETAFYSEYPGNYVMLGNLVIGYKGEEETTTIPENAKILTDSSMRKSNTLKKITVLDKLKEIGNHSISECTNLEEIEIPSNVTDIAYAAFASDTALENVTLNEGLTSIEKDAFLNCPQLHEITIPKSVTTIGEHAIGYSNYSYDYSIYDYVINKYSKEELPTINCWYGTAGYEYAVAEEIPYKLLDEKPPVTPTPTATPRPTATPKPTAAPKPTTAPKPLKKGATFTVKTSKYKVTGTRTVAYTGTTNKKATKITIGQTVSYKGITYKITSVYSKALRNNAKVTQITIGNNVASVGASAFEGCKVLKNVTVGTGVKTLGANTFKNCKKLSLITIKSKQLKSVGSNAFKGIYAKAKIRVPSSKLKAYQKLLKKKGQGSKVKITK